MNTTNENANQVETMPSGFARQSSPQPFEFYEAVYLVEVTTLKAATVVATANCGHIDI